MKYQPKFLSWAKSFDEEVSELKELIQGRPDDLDLLLNEYEELTGKKYRSGDSMKKRIKKIKRKNPSTELSLYAQPYDLEAKGFYFNSLEDYEKKAAKNKNSYGGIVEEYEYQFIDGSDFSDGQKVLDAVGLKNFFEISDGWKKSEIERLEMFIEIEGSQTLEKDLDDIKNQLENVIYYEGDSLYDLTYGMFEDYYSDLKNLLEENQALDWFDWEAYVKAHFDGTFKRVNGKTIYFEYAE